MWCVISFSSSSLSCVLVCLVCGPVLILHLPWDYWRRNTSKASASPLKTLRPLPRDSLQPLNVVCNKDCPTAPLFSVLQHFGSSHLFEPSQSIFNIMLNLCVMSRYVYKYVLFVWELHSTITEFIRWIIHKVHRFHKMSAMKPNASSKMNYQTNTIRPRNYDLPYSPRDLW